MLNHMFYSILRVKHVTQHRALLMPLVCRFFTPHCACAKQSVLSHCLSIDLSVCQLSKIIEMHPKHVLTYKIIIIIAILISACHLCIHVGFQSSLHGRYSDPQLMCQ